MKENRTVAIILVVLFMIVSIGGAISFLYAEPKVIAILPFENLHKKPHLEFVKNIVHEKLFTELGSTTDVIARSEATKQSQDRDSHASLGMTNDIATRPSGSRNDIVIGVSSLDDAKKLYEISGGKLPTVILQGEYFMIRDRMALNVSLLSPKDGSRIDGTGELVVYKGHRHPELSGQANFQQSLYEDIQEPLNKLIKGIQELIAKEKN